MADLASPYDDLYTKYGKLYGVDPELLKAEGAQESHFNPNAVGPDTDYGKAVGIAQFTPETASSLGITDRTDPKQSIEAQAKLMAENLKRYKNVNDAVAAYHGGTNKQNWGPKTKDYVQKVTSNYSKFKAATPTAQIKSVTPVAQQTTMTQDPNIDPLESAESEISSGKNFLPNAASSSNVADHTQDPLEMAAQEISSGKVASQQTPAASGNKVQQAEKKPLFGKTYGGTALDIAESIPSGFVRGVNELPRLPGQTYQFASRLGAQGGNKLYNLSHDQPLTPEQEQQNIANAGKDTVGNFLTQDVPTVYQALSGDTNDQFLENKLHQPTTGLGEFAGNVSSALPGGRALGIKAAPTALGASGAQLAGEDNPAGQLLGGAAVGAAPAAYKAARFRAEPQEVAHKIVQGENGIKPDEINSQEIIPGSKPTLAESTNDANIAAIERQYPESQNQVEAQRELARKNYVNEAVGTPKDVQQARQQLGKDVADLYETAGSQPLNPDVIKPVIDKLDTAVTKYGKESDAGKLLLKIKKKIGAALPGSKDVPTGLLDESGKPLTKAESQNVTQSPMVQVFREERDKFDQPRYQDPEIGILYSNVKHDVQPIIKELGNAIKSQSPEFAKAQQIYSERIPGIKAAEWMQDLNLTDASGNYTLAKVKRALDEAKERQADGDFKLSPKQMDSLQNLHDDLLRRNKTSAQGKVRGDSGTAQNLRVGEKINAQLKGEGANKLLEASGGPSAAGAFLGSKLGALVGVPGLGAYIGDIGGRSLASKGSKRAMLANENLRNFLFQPEEYKQYLLDQQNSHFLNRFKENLLLGAPKNP